MNDQLPDGIYIGLDEKTYFSQNRLGSTDIKHLSKPNAENWFYASRYNRRCQDEEPTEDLLFGKALHAFVLEGYETFARQFVRSEFDDYSKAGARAEKNSLPQGIHRLKPGTYADVMFMARLVLNHPEMGDLFAKGLSELTILFTYNDVKMRARLDKILPEFIFDLKTYGGHAERLYDEDTLIDIVVQMRYEGQRHLYSVARSHMAEFVRDGKVFGGTDEEIAKVRSYAAEEQWQWVWIFYQKVKHSRKNPVAPILTPLVRDPQDATYVRGQLYVDKAVENYKYLMNKFKGDPWMRINAHINPSDDAFIQRYTQPRHIQYDLTMD